ncbi:MAG: glycosyltransferase family 2 protein [Bacteroidia bacterium]|nr:glycosyltransferase family 2 protein [Bacteroidia bacterium]
MALPSVTIGIPVYNEGKYITETLLSAVNQSYPELKILVSDNASTDNTLEEIRKVADRFPNITVVSQPGNIGATNNFEYVMQNAGTEYFCWLGGHDILHPDFIQKAVNAFLSDSSLSLTYPESQAIDEKGNPLNTFPNSKIDTSNLSFAAGPVKVLKNLGACTAIHGLYKTHQIKKYKIKEIVGADGAVLYYISLMGKLKSLNEILYFRREVRKESADQIMKRYNEYGLMNRSKTNPYKEMISEHCRITLNAEIPFLRKVFLLLAGLPVLIARVYYYNYVKKK